jgi:release factor glutamine methyltransferase
LNIKTLLQRSNNSLDAACILSYVLKKDRSFLIAFSETVLSESEVSEFESLFQRREAFEPLAYIVGEKEFWSLPFKVSPDVLIPRPETECLVQWVLDNNPQDEPLNIADLGTGSGAIAIALAHECPDWQLFATDLSEEALAIAKENAAALGVTNVEFSQGRWCEALSSDLRDDLDVIISNPPYIADDDEAIEAHVKQYEPAIALFSDDEGLHDLETIADQARHFLKRGGWLVLEHGCTQSFAVGDGLDSLSYQDIECLQDYSGLDRFVVGRR